MARQARKVSPTGYYHVMMRGNNKEKIFIKEKDKYNLIKMLKTATQEDAISFVAYCFMDNHVHLLIKGDLNDMSSAMKKVNIKYAMTYNKKYDRVGHVFQDRYKSQVIIDDTQLLRVMRYIHKNPVKAKIVENIDLYKWSSYNEYKVGVYDLVNNDEGKFVMGCFSHDKESFCKFHSEYDTEIFLDTKEEMEEHKLTITQKLISDYLENHEISADQLKKEPNHQKRLIEILIDKSKLSHRKIADLLEVSGNLVHKINLNKVSGEAKRTVPYDF